MKNQYFGDKRDFWKYDLLMELAEHAVGRKRITIVPMLTPDNAPNEGKLTKYAAGPRRADLCAFLQRCVAAGVRDVSLLQAYLWPLGWELRIHHRGWLAGDGAPDYFAALPAGLATDAVVFVDPDTGLDRNAKLKQADASKYLRYADAATVHAQLLGASVLVIYQHLQHNAHKHEGDVVAKCQKLSGELGGRSVWGVWAGDLAFLVAAGPTADGAKLEAALQAYAARVGMKVVVATGLQ